MAGDGVTPCTSEAELRTFNYIGVSDIWNSVIILSGSRDLIYSQFDP